MNIRKIALITFIATVFGSLMPLRNAAQTAMEISAAHPFWKWWIYPAMAVVLIPLSAIMPAFYFALYRYERPLEFPRRFRFLSLAGALISTIVTAGDLLKQVGLVNEISNLAYILLLFAFSRHSNLESMEPNVTACGLRLLTFITRIAVIVWTVIVAIAVVRVFLMPYVYFQSRDYALQIGRTPPKLGDWMAKAFRFLISQGCLLVVPFIIYKTMVRSRGDEASPALDDTVPVG